jgi:hypothetical protein
MTGLDPAIQPFCGNIQDVGARHKVYARAGEAGP